MNRLRLRLPVIFIVALILSILPLPAFLVFFKPPWILLSLLYVAFFLPAKSNLAVIVILGLILDVLLSTILGAHAFALIATLGLTFGKARRFQFFPMVHQIILVGFFCFFYQNILMFINALQGLPYNLWIPLASCGLGMLFWPWIRLFGDEWLLSRFGYARR